MKTALFVVGQLALFVVFYLVFLGGSLLDPFHLKWFIVHPTPTSTRYFVPDGLLLTAGLYVIILAAEAAAKKMRRAGLWTTVTFILVLVIVFSFTTIGFVTKDMY